MSWQDISQDHLQDLLIHANDGCKLLFFLAQQGVKVGEEGKSTPLLLDKHLSTDCRLMRLLAQREGARLAGMGSSPTCCLTCMELQAASLCSC